MTKYFLTMKKAIFSLLLVGSISAQAQLIKSGSEWYDGGLNYTATVLNNGSIRMSAMAEGEELQFDMNPISDLPNQYLIHKGPDFEWMSSIEEGALMKVQQQDGITAICAYCTNRNGVEDVYLKTTDDSQALNIRKMQALLKGTYTRNDGKRVVIGSNTISVGSEAGTFEIVTFNGMALNIIQLSGITGAKYWMMVPTQKGYNLYTGEFDEYGMFSQGRRIGSLIESDPQVGRFDATAHVVLNGSTLSQYKKETLRLMRNEIMARHGYVFQAQDLKDYFSREPWYKPCDDNSSIKLSFIEQLNVDLIIGEENRAQRNANEED